MVAGRETRCFDRSVDRVLKATQIQPMRLSGSGPYRRAGRPRRSSPGFGFAVAGGEMLAVTGPNGAGKSTLLRMVAGLLQPAAGAIPIDPEPAAGIAGRSTISGISMR